MGLDCTHGAFNGPYSAFNRLRQTVAKACGASFPPHPRDALDNEGELLSDDLIYFPESWNENDYPGLREFLGHSDCDGEISPNMCKIVADELESLLPIINAIEQSQKTVNIRGLSHYIATQKFIAGCLLAYERNESLEFC